MSAPATAKPLLGTTTHKELVARLRAGDAEAYEQTVKAYGGRMLNTARRIVSNEDEARDCVQNAFLQAFRHIDRFEERASVGTWLHRIVVNEALMKVRKRTTRKEESLDDLLPTFDAQGCRLDQNMGALRSAEEIIAGQESRHHVRQAVSQLPDIYRSVLVLRDLEGYSTQETASLLEMPIGTVKVRLHRARAALKKLLEPILYGDTQ